MLIEKIKTVTIVLLDYLWKMTLDVNHVIKRVKHVTLITNMLVLNVQKVGKEMKIYGLVTNDSVKTLYFKN